MGTADEGSFLELLIANERIQKWLDEVIKLDGTSKRHEIVDKLYMFIYRIANLVDSLLNFLQVASNPAWDGRRSDISRSLRRGGRSIKKTKTIVQLK